MTIVSGILVSIPDRYAKNVKIADVLYLLKVVSIPDRYAKNPKAKELVRWQTLVFQFLIGTLKTAHCAVTAASTGCFNS